MLLAEVGEKAPDSTLPEDDRKNRVALEEYTKVVVVLEGLDGAL